MLRRLLFASALILVSTTAFTSEAKAQTATTGTVEFSGVVGGACTFSDPVAGILVPNTTGDALGSDSSNPEYSEGSEATIDINCTTGATLSIAEPVATGDPLTGATLSANATSSNLGLDFASDGSGAKNTIASGEQDTIRVNMSASNGANLDPGTYSYEVVITATP
ncbi:hypothetical protein [Mastigocoleus testarum]|uniref:Spore coat protein U domain-containing protein n=1 Tax=Mastigocoleus testarum BC008 TaxID=371196 RepID=A0A0V7ZGK6_9CYAN|nr:hypothetical protein [Mastigocoleus testarum]KST63689.1 hypothetical protein BC008_14630 [Mastigocoleus testarum BC008]KST63769.1 hypothetical protein BC008_15045 [Mastigocoleus testarum BC008]